MSDEPWDAAKRGNPERTWVFPWDASSALPDDGLLCDECLTGGDDLTTWVEYRRVDSKTVEERHVLTLHGRCMTQSPLSYEDDLRAERAKKARQ